MTSKMKKFDDALSMVDFPQTISHQKSRRQPTAFQFHVRKRCFDRVHREEYQTLDRLNQPLLFSI